MQAQVQTEAFVLESLRSLNTAVESINMQIRLLLGERTVTTTPTAIPPTTSHHPHISLVDLDLDYDDVTPLDALLTPEKLHELATRYITGGVTLIELAQEVGCSDSTLGKRLREYARDTDLEELLRKRAARNRARSLCRQPRAS